MRSRLSFITTACLAVVSTLAASGCASNSANANGANAAPSSAASTTTQTTTTQTTTADQSAAAQSNTQGASANNATAGQSASAPGSSNAGGATTANASGAGRDVDACALLTSDDIKSVQGEAVKESKPSRHEDSSLRTSQCFFTTATFNKSVSLEVTTSADGHGARRFWDERFERTREDAGKGEKEREREKKEREADKKKAGGRVEEEDEEGALPTAIKGIGDEAYWAASRVNGTLYARKGDSFVRISVGGTDADAERLRKAKALAQKALSRM